MLNIVQVWVVVKALLDPGSLPLYLILSATFFFPLIIPLNVNESAINVTDENSTMLLVIFACATSITIPLLLDIILDFISMRKTPYLLQRLLSTLVFAVSNVVVISFLYTPSAEEVLITMFTWSYFLEFAIILSSMQDLLGIKRNKRSAARMVFADGGIYAFFLGSLLNTTSEAGGIISACVAFCGLNVSTLMVIYRLYSVLRSHYLSFKSSGDSFLGWYSSAPSSAVFVQIRLVGKCLQLVALYVTLFGFRPRYNFSDAIIYEGNILPLMVVRVIFYMFEYLVASRIFRRQMIQEHHDLGFKTKLIKYFSHEVRSPLMVILFGADLIHQSITKMKATGFAEWDTTIEDNNSDIRRSCKQSLEILDNMILYDTIARDSLKLDLHVRLPLQAIREALLVHSSAANGLQVGVFLHFFQEQFGRESGVLHLNMTHLRHVFEPVLSCVFQNTAVDPTTDSPVNAQSVDTLDNMVSECIIAGSTPSSTTTHVVHVRLIVDKDLDLHQSVLKTQLMIRNSSAPPNSASRLPSWLHVVLTMKKEAVSDSDIHMMHSRGLEFVREG